MSNTSKKRFKIWGWLGVLIFIPAIVVASWAGTEYMIERTSGAEFCVSCHTMESVAAAYLTTKHSGKNRLGIRAECTDCHLPHDSAIHYLWTKATSGVHDAWLQLTYDPEKTDRAAKRAERHEFVYDSGCLKCHSGLEQSTNPAHPAYFAGGANPFSGAEDKLRCVNCHYDVGHHDVSDLTESAARE